MQNLKQASEELFRRGPDECFATFDDLYRHCVEVKEKSVDRWQGTPSPIHRAWGPRQPSGVTLDATSGGLRLGLGKAGSFGMNNWPLTPWPAPGQ